VRVMEDRSTLRVSNDEIMLLTADDFSGIIDLKNTKIGMLPPSLISESCLVRLLQEYKQKNQDNTPLIPEVL